MQSVFFINDWASSAQREATDIPIMPSNITLVQYRLISRKEILASASHLRPNLLLSKKLHYEGKAIFEPGLESYY
jgi:hypothetical protein